MSIVLELSLPASSTLTPEQGRGLLESPALELAADLTYVESFRPPPVSQPHSAFAAGGRPLSVLGRPTMPMTPAPQPAVDKVDEAYAGVQGTCIASMFWKPGHPRCIEEVDSKWTGRWLVKGTVGESIPSFRPIHIPSDPLVTARPPKTIVSPVLCITFSATYRPSLDQRLVELFTASPHAQNPDGTSLTQEDDEYALDGLERTSLIPGISGGGLQ
jgi:hypothetical protein